MGCEKIGELEKRSRPWGLDIDCMDHNQYYTPKACSTVRPCGPNQSYIKHHNSSQVQLDRCTLHARLQKHSECSK